MSVVSNSYIYAKYSFVWYQMWILPSDIDDNLNTFHIKLE